MRDSEVFMANALLWGLILFSALQAARPAATVSPQAFASALGVGTESWAIEKPPPGARPEYGGLFDNRSGRRQAVRER